MVTFRRKFLETAVLASLLAGPYLSAQTPPAENRRAAATVDSHATDGPGSSTLNRPLLPPAFAGQPREGDVVIDPTPVTVDAAHADLLKEDGMIEASVAHYGGLGGSRWTVQSIRFGDVTGAFAAFTFYRSPDMHAEPVGDASAASPGVFLVQSGATLVLARGATGARIDPARLRPEMKFLVSGLPRISGPSAIPPPLPGLLPRTGLDPMSVHYAVGPAGYNGPLPVSVLGFRSAAEVVTAAYPQRGGAPAIVTLDMLPTPELAEASLRAIRALPDASLHTGLRRMGSLVATVSGSKLDAAAADALLKGVRYAPAITADIVPPKPTNEVAKTAQLLVAIAEFTGLMAVCAVVLALFLAFGRVWFRRMRGKPDSSLHDDSFITLRLK